MKEKICQITWFSGIQSRFGMQICRNRGLFKLMCTVPKGSSTWANKAPLFSADFENFTSYGMKLELKKGTFSASCRRSLRPRWHELIKGPFSAPISITYEVNFQNWSWKRASFQLHVDRVDMSLNQTLFQLQFCAIYFIWDQNWSWKRERFRVHVNAVLGLVYMS